MANNPIAAKLLGKRVIIASSDPAIRGGLPPVLRQLGVDVLETANGVEALRMLDAQTRRKRKVNFVIASMTMPRMDAAALTRSIREIPAHAELPIGVVHTPAEDRKAHICRVNGANELFQMPLDLKILLNWLLKEIATVAAQVETAYNKKMAFDEHAEFTDLNFPFKFGGFPRPKNYALRTAFYRCPFCESTFTAPRLISRALREDPNDYMGIGVYIEALERDFLDYILVEPIVCPKCLYTADRSGMYRIQLEGNSSLTEMEAIELKEWGGPYFANNVRLQEKFTADTSAREKIVRTASNNGMGLFAIDDTKPEYPRRLSDALVAFEVAIQCASDILPSQLGGEAQARLHQKIAAYHLKRYHVYGLELKQAQATKPTDRTKIAQLQRTRRDVLVAAMGEINQANDIEFNVLEERLYCQTRRFFIADLLAKMADGEQKEKLSVLRKKALGMMRSTLIWARQNQPDNIKIVERFLLPLENRIIELENEEKAVKNAAADK